MVVPATVMNFPNIGRRPSTSTFGIESNTTTFQSPIGGTTQTLEVPGAFWRGSVRYNNLQYDEARELRAFLTSLRGASGRFWFGDLSYVSPSFTNPWRITSTVSTFRDRLWVSDTNNTLSAVDVLFPGDYIAFQYSADSSTDIYHSLHMVTHKATIQRFAQAPNSRMLVRFTPNLRRTPLLNSGNPRAFIVINDRASTGLNEFNAVSVFRLEEDSVMWSTRPPNIHNLSFSFIEAFG